MGIVKKDRVERLDYADRWLTDGFRVLQASPPGMLVTIDVDMTNARRVLDALRERGVRGSYAGVLIRAAGLALARSPDLHQSVRGTRRVHPGNVSIGLSVNNEAVAAPVMHVEDVPGKLLPALCEEVARRAPAVRADDSRTLKTLRRWGWLLPFGWMRRGLLRLLFGSLWFRRVFGSVQVSVLPSVDVSVPLVFGATAVLAMGRVAERVVARAGEPVVRLVATLACVGDHKTWNGEQIGRLVSETRAILESGELCAELPVAVGDPSADALVSGEAERVSAARVAS